MVARPGLFRTADLGDGTRLLAQVPAPNLTARSSISIAFSIRSLSNVRSG
jgi:hypothetical protein